jgi:diaminohydroxyphosphoribosylaminopyrimidine deaminase/5-amino-6-(5-phosphoribosylamino)uracil reductase
MYSSLDLTMMRRALQIARGGEGFTTPNPCVGAVITGPSGLIIGEGFTSPWGGAHAEVNAVRRVKDEALLRGATVYVTLEPCSHFGKTPPCADMLISKRVGRVVIGTLDPFKEVSGRGVRKLRRAGIKVDVGLLEQECRESNRQFIFAHTHARPYVMLKWAMSSDGFISAPGGKPVRISTPLTQVWMHRQRARMDAIMVGSNTVITDNPRLNCRLWPNRKTRPVVLDRRHRVPAESHIALNSDSIIVNDYSDLPSLLSRLYSSYSITSLMVEGGSELIGSFFAQGLVDEIRVEISPLKLGGGVEAPRIPELYSLSSESVDGNELFTWRREIL